MGLLHRYLYNKYFPHGVRWLPMVAVYYLTYRCHLNCTYCSDGNGLPYKLSREENADPVERRKILRAIRVCCDELVITGGEPAFHDEFSAVLEEVRDLRFREVTITTKGDRLAGLDKLLNDSITRLVVSIDTIDSAKAASMTGSADPVLERALSSVRRLAAMPGRKFDIYLSSVVCPENIGELRDVYSLAKELGLWYAAQPQLIGVKPAPGLAGNAEYRDFYNFLIGELRGGGRIFGTPQYLEWLRDFTRFRCYPFTMLVVASDGATYYPCLEQGRKIGKIQDAVSIDHLRCMGLGQFGPYPECDSRCHSACAAGYAALIDSPLSALRQLFQTSAYR